MTAEGNWLGRVFQPAQGPVPWIDVARSGLFLPVPMAVAEVTGHPAAGLYGTLGALLAILAERSGTTGQRVARIAAAGACTVSMLAGPGTAGSGLGPLLLVMAFAAAAAVLSSLNPLLSFAGMQLLVQMSIAGGLPQREPAAVIVAWYAGGIGWVLLGVLAEGAFQRTGRLYRTTLAGIVRDLADEVEAGRAVTYPLDARLADLHAMTAAAVGLRRARRRELAAVLALAEEVTELLPWLTAVAARCPAGGRRAVSARLGRLGDDIAAGLAPLAGCPESARSVADPAASLTGRAVAAIDAVGTGRRPAPRRGRLWLSGLVPGGYLRARLLSYLGRLVPCLAAAEIVRQLLPWPRGYWILLTVALTLKPDFQSVLARTLQRAGGTIAGSLIAAAVLLSHSVPVNLAAMALLAAPIPWAVRRNYAYFTVLITPIVLLILGFLSPVGPAAVADRVAQTVLGCAIVTCFGWLTWRGTWLPPSRPQVAGVLTDLASYLGGPPGTPGGTALSRYALTRSAGEIRAVAAHGALEPPVIRRRRARWSGLVDDIAAAVAASGPALANGDQAGLREAAGELAAAAGDLRPHWAARAVPVPGPPAGDLGAAVARLRQRVDRVYGA